MRYPDRLTPRERSILDALIAGHSNKEIARLLSLRPKTVKNRIEILLHKTHSRNRTELAVAYLLGFIGPFP